MTIQIPYAKLDLGPNSIRRILMVLLALVMTHLISYQKSPFSSDYSFPVLPFSIILLYGIFICEFNAWNYRKLGVAGTGQSHIKISKLVTRNLLTCFAIFSVLTTVQMLVFQFIMDPFRFAGLLSICLMISLIETGVFVVYGLTTQRRLSTLHKNEEGQNYLTIVRNNDLLRFRESDVNSIFHECGCVFLVDNAGRKFTTQFKSLTEVEPKLSSGFYRANRQMLVSRQAIDSIKKESNHKLSVHLRHHSELIRISRYKSTDFKKWLQS